MAKCFDEQNVKSVLDGVFEAYDNKEDESKILELVERLEDCELYETNSKEENVPMKACINNHFTIIDHILSNTAFDMNMKINRKSIVLYALKECSKEVIFRFLNHKNFQVSQDLFLLYNYWNNSNIDILRELVFRPTTNINLLWDNNADTTLFMHLANNGRTQCVKVFLEHPLLDINSQNKDGWSPLMAASYWGYVEVVEMLLNNSMHKIDINAKNNEGFTALNLARKGSKRKTNMGGDQVIELLENYKNK